MERMLTWPLQSSYWLRLVVQLSGFWLKRRAFPVTVETSYDRSTDQPQHAGLKLEDSTYYLATSLSCVINIYLFCPLRRSSSKTRERSVGCASPGGMRGSRVTAHTEPPPRPAWTDTSRPVSEIQWVMRHMWNRIKNIIGKVESSGSSRASSVFIFYKILPPAIFFFTYNEMILARIRRTAFFLVNFSRLN